MPAERDAVCPKCQAVRSTRAPARTVLVCFGCGERFRAPASVPAAAPSGVEPSPAGVGTGTPGPVPTAGGVKVQRADSVKVAQVARPRERGQAAGLEEPAPEIPREPVFPVPTHPLTERARATGRRGGSAVSLYRRQVQGR